MIYLQMSQSATNDKRCDVLTKGELPYWLSPAGYYLMYEQVVSSITIPIMIFMLLWHINLQVVILLMVLLMCFGRFSSCVTTLKKFYADYSITGKKFTKTS